MCTLISVVKCIEPAVDKLHPLPFGVGLTCLRNVYFPISEQNQNLRQPLKMWPFPLSKQCMLNVVIIFRKLRTNTL